MRYMKCGRLFPIALGSLVLVGPLHGQETSQATDSSTESVTESTPDSSKDSKDSPLVEQAEKTKRERAARRSAGQPPAKTFNNDNVKRVGKPPEDLAPSAEATVAAAAGSDAAGAKGAASEAKTEKTEDQLRAEHRDAIQKKIDDQVKLMDIVREAMDDAQAELNDLTNYTIGSRRGALLKRLEDGKAEIAKAEQTIADLEEEARREGISVSRP